MRRRVVLEWEHRYGSPARYGVPNRERFSGIECVDRAVIECALNDGEPCARSGRKWQRSAGCDGKSGCDCDCNRDADRNECNYADSNVERVIGCDDDLELHGPHTDGFLLFDQREPCE
jgi:hypothetical protein